MHHAQQSFKTAEESKFHKFTLLKVADKAINCPCCCTHAFGTWHQQSDQFELKICFMSQVMPHFVHKYMFSQAICKLLPKQLLSFCYFKHEFVQSWAISLSVRLIS